MRARTVLAAETAALAFAIGVHGQDQAPDTHQTANLPPVPAALLPDQLPLGVASRISGILAVNYIIRSPKGSDFFEATTFKVAPGIEVTAGHDFASPEVTALAKAPDSNQSIQIDSPGDTKLADSSSPVGIEAYDHRPPSPTTDKLDIAFMDTRGKSKRDLRRAPILTIGAPPKPGDAVYLAGYQKPRNGGVRNPDPSMQQAYGEPAATIRPDQNTRPAILGGVVLAVANGTNPDASAMLVAAGLRNYPPSVFGFADPEELRAADGLSGAPAFNGLGEVVGEETATTGQPSKRLASRIKKIFGTLPEGAIQIVRVQGIQRPFIDRMKQTFDLQARARARAQAQR